MRKANYFYFGEYKQTIVLEGKKIIDATCNCVYAKNNKDMWKNPDKKPCKHSTSALLHLDLKTKKQRAYLLIKSPGHPNAVNGFVPEHRLVAEKFIGRYLTKEEVIHHLDENKKNNKIENLMIFSNQTEHMKFHLKLKQFGITNPIKRQIENRWEEYK